MKLNELTFTAGSRKESFRKGRGVGSGNGKTAGKGHKGQNARSGGGVALGFEGGQNPIYRRLPKRGFTNYTRKEYAIVNVEQLEVFNDGDVVNIDSLIEQGLIKKNSKDKNVLNGVKILGRGELTKKLNVSVTKISKSAIAIIEKNGGTVKVEVN